MWRYDVNNNRAPAKAASSGRIDGISAAAMAIGCAINLGASQPAPYQHEVIVI